MLRNIIPSKRQVFRTAAIPGLFCIRKRHIQAVKRSIFKHFLPADIHIQTLLYFFGIWYIQQSIVWKFFLISTEKIWRFIIISCFIHANGMNNPRFIHYKTDCHAIGIIKFTDAGIRHPFFFTHSVYFFHLFHTVSNRNTPCRFILWCFYRDLPDKILIKSSVFYIKMVIGSI